MVSEMPKLYLERIDAAQNVRRFYYAYVGPTFCGPRPEGPRVVRIHGRKGVWRRMLPPLVFADAIVAAQWLDRQRRRKLRRGYCEVGLPPSAAIDKQHPAR